MNAVVQAVEEIPQWGERIVTLRPLTIMTAQQMMQLLRQVRSRRRSTNPLTQTDRNQSRNQAVALPKGSHRANAMEGRGVPELSKVHNGQDSITLDCSTTQQGSNGKVAIAFEGGLTVTIDKTKTVWQEAGSKELKIREVCARQGTRQGRMLVIGSEIF